MRLFRKLLYIIRYKTKGAGRMLDHNISFWFVAHEFNANNLYCHWVYTAPHLTISRNIIITISKTILGIRGELNAFARVSPLTPSELARFPCITPMLTHKSELIVYK